MPSDIYSLGRSTPTPTGAAAGTPPAMPMLPPELLGAWLRLWVNRTQPYARQRPDGSYRWIAAPCDADTLLAHLVGERTIALSSTDARGWCRWLCLDCDAEAATALPRLVALRAALYEEHAIPGLVEASRRGGHLWIFLEEPVPAVEARYCVLRALAQLADAGLSLPSLEVYPDTRRADALAQAVRLPLGVHRRTGQRYPLLAADGTPLADLSIEAAMRHVLAVPRLMAERVHAHWAAFVGTDPGSGVAPRAASRPVSPTDRRAYAGAIATTEADEGQEETQVGHIVPGILATATTSATRSPVIRWVDACVSPLELLEELAPEVAIRRSGHGYIGWCPFHDDRAPDAAGQPGTASFYVVFNARYGWSWRCLSSNCAYGIGPMRHTFRLFQLLLHLGVPQAIQAAGVRWPRSRIHPETSDGSDVADGGGATVHTRPARRRLRRKGTV